MENIILYIRRKKNIKQTVLAKALHVSPSYLCKIERGLQDPTEKFIKICSKYLNISPVILFPDKIDKENIEDINNSFKNKLWAARKEKGIKQNKLANLLGCSPSYLSKIEKGLQKPNDVFKKKCAKILKIKEVDLFP